MNAHEMLVDASLAAKGIIFAADHWNCEEILNKKGNLSSNIL